MTLTELIILGFATFRIALLVSKEDGPYWLFAKLRRLPPAKSSLREGLSCPWCVSVWAGSLVLVAMRYPWAAVMVYGMALSGVAICLNQTFTKGK